MQNTVTRWVRHELLDRVAAEHGLVVSDGEVDALIASSLSSGTRKDLEQAAAQQASVPSGGARAVRPRRPARAQARERSSSPVARTTSSKPRSRRAYAKAAKQQHVSVSPRYGTFDEVVLRITPARNDLSIPLASQVAAGEPSTSPTAPATSPSASP